MPMEMLANGRSTGGDNLSFSFASLAPGGYWIVFVYGGGSFRAQFTKR